MSGYFFAKTIKLFYILLEFNMAPQQQRDARGRYTAASVHKVVGHRPRLALEKTLVDKLRDVQHLIDDIVLHVNVNPGGAKALIHHALAEEAEHAGGLDWGTLLNGAQKVFGVAQAVAPHALAAYKAAREASGGAWSLRGVLDKSKAFARHVAKMARNFVRHAPAMAEYASTFGQRGSKVAKHLSTGAKRAESLAELISRVSPEEPTAVVESPVVQEAVKEAVKEAVEGATGSGISLGGFALGGYPLGGLILGGGAKRKRGKRHAAQ